MIEDRELADMMINRIKDIETQPLSPEWCKEARTTIIRLLQDFRPSSPITKPAFVTNPQRGDIDSPRRMEGGRRSP